MRTTLESLYKMQVENSEELKYVLCVQAQETTFGDKENTTIAELMARRHLEQKIKDARFKARKQDEDRPTVGAPSKGKTKEKAQQMSKHNSERGDCIRWIT